jgi:hypothetical protein
MKFITHELSFIKTSRENIRANLTRIMHRFCYFPAAFALAFKILFSLNRMAEAVTLVTCAIGYLVRISDRAELLVDVLVPLGRSRDGIFS